MLAAGTRELQHASLAALERAELAQHRAAKNVEPLCQEEWGKGMPTASAVCLPASCSAYSRCMQALTSKLPAGTRELQHASLMALERAELAQHSVAIAVSLPASLPSGAALLPEAEAQSPASRQS